MRRLTPELGISKSGNIEPLNLQGAVGAEWRNRRRRPECVKGFEMPPQSAYFTEQPYGRDVGTLTDFPAIASASACDT